MLFAAIRKEQHPDINAFPKKKYTVVFIESDDELIICEFISSKLIYW